MVSPVCSRRLLPAATNLNIAIGLPLRNHRGARRSAPGDLSFPPAPMSSLPDAGEFAASSAPRTRLCQVAHFTRANGLTITAMHANRILLDVSGKAGHPEGVNVPFTLITIRRKTATFLRRTPGRRFHQPCQCRMLMISTITAAHAKFKFKFAGSGPCHAQLRFRASRRLYWNDLETPMFPEQPSMVPARRFISTIRRLFRQ